VTYSSHPIEVQETTSFADGWRVSRTFGREKGLLSASRGFSLAFLGTPNSFTGLVSCEWTMDAVIVCISCNGARSLIILLCGGDKSSQDRDIKRAIAMAKEIDDGSRNIPI
jgi:hypothetical protein